MKFAHSTRLGQPVESCASWHWRRLDISKPLRQSHRFSREQVVEVWPTDFAAKLAKASLPAAAMSVSPIGASYRKEMSTNNNSYGYKLRELAGGKLARAMKIRWHASFRVRNMVIVIVVFPPTGQIQSCRGAQSNSVKSMCIMLPSPSSNNNDQN